MNEAGLMHAIRVRRSGDRFIVVDGERRLHAARLLKWESIDAIIEERELSSAEITQRQLIANCMRKNLSPVEVGRAIEALMMKTGWSATEVGRKLGLSGPSVSRFRALVKLPATMQEHVENGTLAASTAYALAKVCDPNKQAELVQEAASGQLTRDAATVKAKRPSKSRKGSTRKRRPNVTAFVGNRRVTMSGSELSDLGAMIGLLDELLGKAKAALSEGIDLEEFLRTLKSKAAA